MNDELKPKKSRKPYTSYKTLYRNLLAKMNSADPEIKYVHDPADKLALLVTREAWDKMKSRAEAAERELAALKAKISTAENEALEIINLLTSSRPNKYKYTDQTGWGLYFWWGIAKQDMEQLFERLKGGKDETQM